MAKASSEIKGQFIKERSVGHSSRSAYQLDHILQTCQQFPIISDHYFETYRYEQVGDFFLIALPGLAILSSASVDISVGAVDDHDHEENEIKPREWASISRWFVISIHDFCKQKQSILPETGNQAP